MRKKILRTENSKLYKKNENRLFIHNDQEVQALKNLRRELESSINELEKSKKIYIELDNWDKKRQEIVELARESKIMDKNRKLLQVDILQVDILDEGMVKKLFPVDGWHAVLSSIIDYNECNVKICDLKILQEEQVEDNQQKMEALQSERERFSRRFYEAKSKRLELDWKKAKEATDGEFELDRKHYSLAKPETAKAAMSSKWLRTDLPLDSIRSECLYQIRTRDSLIQGDGREAFLQKATDVVGEIESVREGYLQDIRPDREDRKTWQAGYYGAMKGHLSDLKPGSGSSDVGQLRRKSFSFLPPQGETNTPPQDKTDTPPSEADEGGSATPGDSLTQTAAGSLLNFGGALSESGGGSSDSEGEDWQKRYGTSRLSIGSELSYLNRALGLSREALPLEIKTVELDNSYLIPKPPPPAPSVLPPTNGVSSSRRSLSLERTNNLPPGEEMPHVGNKGDDSNAENSPVRSRFSKEGSKSPVRSHFPEEGGKSPVESHFSSLKTGTKRHSRKGNSHPLR